MARMPAGARRQQILETLALQLQSMPGDRITTARLAAEVGVSEAALYRHFPSKGAMFEALIEFAEQTVFGVAARITAEPWPLSRRTHRFVATVLTFAARNPGICRVLQGGALSGEDDQVQARAAQFFARVESELRKMFRDADLDDGERTAVPGSRVAALLSALAEGRVSRYVRSGFKELPDAGWDEEWTLLVPQLMRAPAADVAAAGLAAMERGEVR